MVWLLASSINTPERFRTALLIWISVSCAVGLAGLYLGTYGSEVYGEIEFRAMSGGGRIGGLGQHPNWFAMGMAFGINPAFALAYTERRRWLRWLLVAAALWLLFVAISTGSRGAVWGAGIGSLFLALHNTRLRQFLYRYWLLIAVVFAIALLAGVGSYTSAFVRVATRGLSTIWMGDVRFANWTVCSQMLVETFGVGVGVGGYETLVPRFNERLSLSQYVYPHGVIWDVMAHYGMVGLGLLAVLGVTTIRRFRRAATAVRGTVLEIWLIGMTASGPSERCGGVACTA